MPSENIKVAIRVRSFNNRERETNSKCIVEMNQNQTVLKPTGADQGEKAFAFDYSYWSFDGYQIEPNGYFSPKESNYCDQKRVYDDLGSGLLKNAFDGYNACILAYGQTGSGKSYSIMGKSPNRGLVPQICENLFLQIKQKQTSNPKDEFEVTFSMIEIYNEVIRDLLNSKDLANRKGIQLHERPGRGFHILEKDLKPIQVCDYTAIANLIEQGNSNKSVAETKMNATSSRAHTIVELTFKQTFKNEKGNVMQRQSVIDLVDLAGSERVDKSMTSGDRLKEGISINLSLSSLGKCISALAAANETRVPYRESALTKLLMNALGGNSKTVMLATISPAESNYQETLSTLRYADRAKRIKCNAIVNEDPKDKIIRELQSEINRLKAQMKNGLFPNDLSSDLSQKEYEKIKKEAEENLRKQIEQNEKEMDSMKRSYEQKLAEAISKAKEIDRAQAANTKKTLTCAHLSNINVDPMLTGALKHPIDFSSSSKKKLILGSGDKCDIQIFGIGVNERHAAITYDVAKHEYYLEPLGNSRVMQNGRVCRDDDVCRCELRNFDRLVFGASLYYLFVDPARFGPSSEATMAKVNNFTVERVQQEIAEQAGLIGSQFDKDRQPDEIACINELIDLMPLVEEANQLSIMMDRKVKYEALILNPIVIGDTYSKPRPVVVVKKFGTSKEWLWDVEKFVDRKACMSEIYLDLRDDGKIDDKRFKIFDPFVDLDTEPVLIGTAVVEFKAMLHRIPIEETSKIYDYRKNFVGNLQVELKPCDRQGIVIEDLGSHIVHDPEHELKDLHFLVRIHNVKSLSPKYKNIYCQFRLFGEENFSKTEVSDEAQHAKINYQRLVSIEKVDQNFIKYYKTYPMFIQVYGNYISSSNENNNVGSSNTTTTKNWFEKEREAKLNSPELVREEYEKVQAELEKLKKKISNLETLLDYAEKKKERKRIRIEYVRECLLSNNPDVLAKLYELIRLNKD